MFILFVVVLIIIIVLLYVCCNFNLDYTRECWTCTVNVGEKLPVIKEKCQIDNRLYYFYDPSPRLHFNIDEKKGKLVYNYQTVGDFEIHKLYLIFNDRNIEIVEKEGTLHISHKNLNDLNIKVVTDKGIFYGKITKSSRFLYQDEF